MKQTETFLLQRWRHSPEDNWKFILKNINTKEVKYFQSIETLVGFLSREDLEIKVYR